ncbi:MAG TPA: formate dehydrogenase accessory protein FdhE [Myxococcota bacterium]|nr:formate dehydrogenase accessory protein FdhE [Myxococcota bacterium]HRY94179.1 formate dehydrogenase accessory protein FdhE [Myxococcota bacterium]HSA20503.1 formate dehydrogenase accessory protein FdhE [Myxococcota bacterium]
MSKGMEAWLERHPFLEPIAHLEATVHECLRRLPQPGPTETDFEPYRAEFEAGVPLLGSQSAGPKLLAEAAGTFAALGESLARAALPEPLAGKLRALHEHIRKAEVLSAIALEREDAASLPHSGTARYLAWKALAHALGPTIESFAAWREGRLWPPDHCPTCGAKPALSLLTKQAEGRRRSLACGLCGTRWPVRRLGCPHCGSTDEAQLAIFELEDEPELRLEVCDLCKGYVKTWSGDEAPFFTDWSTLHLDAMARDRGYQRLGASLYEL